LEYLGVYGRIMDLQKEWVGMNRIDLAQDTDRWWAPVNAVITFGFHTMWGISRLVE
jgi:hypothetical protein